MESRPSSTSNACLESGAGVGVAKLRARPAYAFERKNCHNDDPTACRHSFVSGSHGSRRTGGIFCWYCRHEICYGYHIMPNAEGSNEAFSFLYKYILLLPPRLRFMIFPVPCKTTVSTGSHIISETPCFLWTSFIDLGTQHAPGRTL